MEYQIIEENIGVEGRPNRTVVTPRAWRQTNAIQKRLNQNKLTPSVTGALDKKDTRKRDVVLKHYARIVGSRKIELVLPNVDSLLGTTDFDENKTPVNIVGNASHMRVSYGYLPAVANSSGEPSPGLATYRSFNPAIPAAVMNGQFSITIGAPVMINMPFNRFMTVETGAAPASLEDQYIELDQELFFYPNKNFQIELELIPGITYTDADGDPGHYLCFEFVLPRALYLG